MTCSSSLTQPLNPLVEHLGSQTLKNVVDVLMLLQQYQSMYLRLQEHDVPPLYIRGVKLVDSVCTGAVCHEQHRQADQEALRAIMRDVQAMGW